MAAFNSMHDICVLQARYGRLQCHYCGLGPLKIVQWDDQYNQNDPMKVRACMHRDTLG